VTLLTSIGEGVHGLVVKEAGVIGADVIAVTPGRVATAGISIGVFGTIRPLTIDDAIAIGRARYIAGTNPSVLGDAEVVAGSRNRRGTVIGASPDMLKVLNVAVASGEFLPREDVHQPRPLAVLGAKMKRELFGDESPLGQIVVIGGNRFRVIGVMQPVGQLLGVERDDAVVIPTARGLELFNRTGVTGIDVLRQPGADFDKAVASIQQVIEERHGKNDVTILTQQQAQDVINSVLGVLRFAVGALGSISLLVGGVGVLTIMTITVSERTSEIGVLRALGAGRGQVLALFLAEAALLAATGGLAGLGLGAGVARLIRMFVPGLPITTPWSFTLLAEAVSVSIGIVAGMLPARSAGRVDPIEALRAE
jgi:putative ABC transport system permease protein